MISCMSLYLCALSVVQMEYIEWNFVYCIFLFKTMAYAVKRCEQRYEKLQMEMNFWMLFNDVSTGFFPDNLGGCPNPYNWRTCAHFLSNKWQSYFWIKLLHILGRFHIVTFHLESDQQLMANEYISKSHRSNRNEYGRVKWQYSLNLSSFTSLFVLLCFALLCLAFFSPFSLCNAVWKKASHNLVCSFSWIAAKTKKRGWRGRSRRQKKQNMLNFSNVK